MALGVGAGKGGTGDIEGLRSELSTLKSSLIDGDLAAMISWPLSPVERRIFGMLLAQDIVTKKTIVTMLHGRAATGSDLKNIDVFMSRIRAKTAAKGVNIETIFGVGYRLDGRETWRAAIADGAGVRH